MYHVINHDSGYFGSSKKGISLGIFVMQIMSDLFLDLRIGM